MRSSSNLQSAICILQSLLLLAVPAAAQTDADLGALREFKVEPTAAGMLDFLAKRTPAAETIKQVDEYIDQLADDEFKVREKATQGLIGLGVISRGRLTEALKSADAEVKRRARWALDRITPPTDDVRILPAVARVLAARKTAGGAEALLALLPHVENADVADVFARSLAPLAADKDGKPEAAVLKALTSESKAVRAAAGMALALGPAANRPLAYKLLTDPAVGVRRRVAVALTESRDGKALPALVALVGEDSEEDSAAAEDLLFAIAGEAAPEVPAEERDPRAAARKGWERWLKAEGAKLDLTKVEMDAPGSNLTLIGTLEIRAVVGKAARQTTVSALDKSFAARWKVEVGSQYQVHASVSRRDRVLVSEYNFSRVQEYDLTGKVHWTYNIANPIVAYRLKNGNTFVATRNSLILLDRDRRPVRTVSRPGFDIASATMFEDGRMALMTTGGVLVRYDRDGKETGSVNTGRYLNVFSRVQFNPDGSFIVPDNGTSKVRAYDKDGKALWETAVLISPTFVVVLPGGNVLVASRNTNQLTELDRTGKEVAKRTASGSQVLFLERR